MLAWMLSSQNSEGREGERGLKRSVDVLLVCELYAQLRHRVTNWKLELIRVMA